MIVGALRVKNEARWIADVLRSIRPLCSRIFVFDDHSEDETPEICEDLGASVYRSRFVGLDESRDKSFLLGLVRAADPDWVLAIDGDEILEDGGQEKILDAIRERPGAGYFNFRILYLWDDLNHVRTDGVYGSMHRGSMFRLRDQGSLVYRSTSAGGNFHCSNLPVGLNGPGVQTSINLWHLGYMHREDRIRKFRWYQLHDPGNEREDCYRHMVIGDLPEYPANVKRTHGGPLRIEPIGQLQMTEEVRA